MMILIGMEGVLFTETISCKRLQFDAFQLSCFSLRY